MRSRIRRALSLGIPSLLASLLLIGAGAPATMADTAAGNAAVAWAQAQEGSTAWDGECLQFVADAYTQAGVNLASMAADDSSAVSFWNTYSGTEYPPTEDPPAGALVFWGATSTNPYGHVAISEGSTSAISSEERDNAGVHEFSIPDRDSQGYQQLGYIVPG
ncbi:MAG TPA: CHAP domain-containing protein [Solirubrobacteraceae bacterium]